MNKTAPDMPRRTARSLPAAAPWRGQWRSRLAKACCRGDRAGIRHHVHHRAAFGVQNTGVGQRHGQMKAQNPLFTVDGGEIRIRCEAKANRLFMGHIGRHIIPRVGFLRLSEDKADAAGHGLSGAFIRLRHIMGREKRDQGGPPCRRLCRGRTAVRRLWFRHKADNASHLPRGPRPDGQGSR